MLHLVADRVEVGKATKLLVSITYHDARAVPMRRVEERSNSKRFHRDDGTGGEVDLVDGRRLSVAGQHRQSMWPFDVQQHDIAAVETPAAMRLDGVLAQETQEIALLGWGGDGMDWHKADRLVRVVDDRDLTGGGFRRPAEAEGRAAGRQDSDGSDRNESCRCGGEGNPASAQR